MTETRTLLVQDKAGVFKITIPADAKVTLSGFNPQAQYTNPTLRIYESKDKQRACFTGVIAFRDLSMPVERIEGAEWKLEEQALSPAAAQVARDTPDEDYAEEGF